MSYYRQSPTKRSPYSRSPVKLLESKRDYIEEEIKLKNAYRSQAENRRLLDEISILQIKTRKIDELEARCDALVKQNSLLTAQNDQLSKQLSDRRYEIQRLRSNSVQVQQRDAFKSNQLGQINRSLEIQIDLLKKERLESSKLYETHIQKLQLMLEDKIKENQSLSVKCNDLLNEKQVAQIRFEEEKNKLKNLVSRTSYDLERELQYTKEKQSAEKTIEIQTLKKNFTSQIVLLEDQISKLKSANAYKNTQFEGQLQENKNIKLRYEEEVRGLIAENDNLRERILKLQEMNKTQVQNVQQKYSDIHTKGTTSLKEQHQRQIKLLLDQIDRQKWIINEKNIQNQNLVREKREQQSTFRDHELALVTEIETLKNKLNVQETQSSQHAHQLMNKINELTDKNLRDSENYFERVKAFQDKIRDLEKQSDYKQGQYDNLKANTNARIADLSSQINELTSKVRNLEGDLKDQKDLNQSQAKANQAYKEESQNERQELARNISQLQVALQKEQQNSENLRGDFSNNDELLKIQIQALKKNIGLLEERLREEQNSHNKEMQELSENMLAKMQKLQQTNKRLFDEMKSSHHQEIDVLNRRVEKLQRDKASMQAKLQEYIDLYSGLEKYFETPHKEAVFKEKASSSIYEVLERTSKSTINIF